MEYWIRIGFTMAMIVVISEVNLSTGDGSPNVTSTTRSTVTSTTHSTAHLNSPQTINKTKNPVQTTKTTSSPVTSTTHSTDNSHATAAEKNFSCPKDVIIDGTLCPVNRKCPANVICDKPSQCPCMDGYKLHNILGKENATECDDIQECFDNVHVCGANTGCRNTIGGYYCTCNKGFRRGNVTDFCPIGNRTENTCSDIDECKENSDLCGPNSTCNNTIGSFLCICISGFKNISNTCTDIDECKENPDICGPNSTCNNTIGSFQCACISGFKNISNNCTDINECEENPQICAPYGDCNNTNGSYECTCKEGYKTIAKQCTVTRCKGNAGICGLKGICVSKQDVITCNCQDGYKAVSLGLQYPQCNVKCKKENETQTACVGTEDECILKRFNDSWTPLCSDVNNSLGSLDTLLDALDDLISKFSSGEKAHRLRMAGKFLNTVEGMIQNLAYLFPDKMPLSNKNNYISAARVTKSSQDGKISLSNTKSSIHLNEKTALGNGVTSVIGSLEYGNITKLLEGAELWKDSQNHSVKLVSPVVSVFLGIANTANLDQPVQLRLSFSDKVTSNETHCAFWSAKNDTWSTEDCVTLERNQDGIVCNCTHLTSFAVLMALKDIQSWTLDLITRIGLSISIVCLALAILTFCCCRILRGTRNTIHIHLCVSLLLGHCIFLIGIEAYANPVVCGIVAGLLHFFYLSAFCWMSLEGLELYLMLVEVFKTQVKTRYLLLMGYGAPIVIITISAAVVPEGYGTKTHCWLSFERNFIWSFMGPVCAIILVNCGIFVLTVWKLAEKMTTINPEQGKLKRLRTLTITSVAQLCILGCCWAFGFLMFGQATLFFAYAFTICNILQGVQIFFLHCLMNKKIREIYGKLICAIVHFRSPVYSEFSNSSNVNTQSRAKLNKESGL